MFNNKTKNNYSVTLEHIDDVYSYIINNKIQNRYSATVLTRRTNINLKAIEINEEIFFIIKTVESDSLFDLMKTIQSTVDNLKEIENNAKFDNSELLKTYLQVFNNNNSELLCNLIAFNYKNYIGALKKIDKVLHLVGYKLKIVKRNDK
jgi:hypothetical protein